MLAGNFAVMGFTMPSLTIAFLSLLERVVDEMAERCDRLEAELLMRDASESNSKSTLGTTSEEQAA